MKNVLFLCGPNGIGKTTICREIVRQRHGTAYVDSDPCRIMNPFVLDDDTIPTVAKNISSLILNYLDCPVVDTVVFSYGFHGRRMEVFQRILDEISAVPHRFVPFLLWCSEEEHIARMAQNYRTPARMERALRESRNAFETVTYPKIDLTELSVTDAATLILETARLNISK